MRVNFNISCKIREKKVWKTLISVYCKYQSKRKHNFRIFVHLWLKWFGLKKTGGIDLWRSSQVDLGLKLRFLPNRRIWRVKSFDYFCFVFKHCTMMCWKKCLQLLKLTFSVALNVKKKKVQNHQTYQCLFKQKKKCQFT